MAAETSKGAGQAAGSKTRLAPSKSTVYVGNLDYSLTNNDLFTIFSACGQVIKASIVKDRQTHESKGVAFILYRTREDALNACKIMNGKVLNDRTIKVSVAKDNGRAAEFIKRRVSGGAIFIPGPLPFVGMSAAAEGASSLRMLVSLEEYVDKSRCYECGQEGHLSYECPKNLLGARERPKKKSRRAAQDVRPNAGQQAAVEQSERGDDSEEEPDPDFDDEGWGSIVAPRPSYSSVQGTQVETRKPGGLKGPKKASGYFSDESEED